MGQAKKYTGEKTEFQPFILNTDMRKAISRTQKHPFLIIELVIAPGRKARIPLYTVAEGGKSDDVDHIVNNLSQTFNMSKKAKEALKEVVARHLNNKMQS
jgi:hypothetical protein